MTSVRFENKTKKETKTNNKKVLTDLLIIKLLFTVDNVKKVGHVQHLFTKNIFT